MKRIKLSTALGIGLAIFVYAVRSDQKRKQFQASRRESVKQGIATWDGEGGNIPAVQTVTSIPADIEAVQNDVMQSVANSQPV